MKQAPNAHPLAGSSPAAIPLYPPIDTIAMPHGIVAVVGMPGSGKSTLAKELNLAFGIPVVSGGDVARQLAAADEAVAKALEAGEFASKDKMNAAMKRQILELSLRDTSAIVEGYPRYQEQMDDLLSLRTQVNVHFVILGCNDGVARERMKARNRTDDTPDAIKERILGFWKETYPIFAGISNEAKFVSIGDKAHAFDVVSKHLLSLGVVEAKS